MKIKYLELILMGKVSLFRFPNGIAYYFTVMS